MTWEENNYLVHYGIKGQKKGQRRFQNEDGTLTAEGKERYGGMKDRGDRGFRKWSPFTNEGGNYAIAKYAARKQGKINAKYEAKREKRVAKGKDTTRIDKKLKKGQDYKNAQDAANRDLDAYRRHSKTSKLFIQNVMGTPALGNAYRHARARGTSRLGSMAEVATPIGGLLLRMHRDKKKYGKRIVLSEKFENSYNALAMDKD